MNPTAIPLLVLVVASSSVAYAEPQRPEPPRSVPQTFPVNPEACKQERIRSGWQRQMQPWADQSEAVKAKLRSVQVELTTATLRRCVEQGLLSPEAARQLATDLGLQATRP
jgi:hypothetical protein